MNKSRVLLAATFVLTAYSADAATLGAAADAYIRGGSQASSSNGSTGDLAVANSTVDSGDFKTYIRFDLSSVAGTISNAQLDLTFAFAYGHSLSSIDYLVLGLPDAAGDNWNESTISWNTAPGNDPGDYYNTTGFSNLGLMSYDPGAANAGDVLSFSSAALDDWLNTSRGADDLVTFVIISAIEVGQHDTWASRENTDYAGPELTFDESTAAVPLPSTLPLLIAGLGGFAFVQRRRSTPRGVCEQ